MVREAEVTTSVHVFRAPSQPATRYRIDLGDTSFTMVTRRRCLLPAMCCRRRRRAANLTAQVYYDGPYFFCRPGKGCKVGKG